MPLRIFQSDTATFGELYDAVLLALGASYPHISVSQEGALKQALLQILELPDLKDQDPAELLRLFKVALDTAQV